MAKRKQSPKTGNDGQTNPSRRKAGKPAPSVVQDREIQATTLSCAPHFWTHQRIADHLGIDRSTVSRAVARGMKKLAADWEEEQHEVRVKHTHYLEHIVMTAMEAFERSKTDSVTVSERVPEKKADNSKPDKPEVTKTTKGQCGDPQFLAQARGALKEIREIWGVDSPKKQEVTGEVTANIGGFLTREQMQEELQRKFAASKSKSKTK